MNELIEVEHFESLYPLAKSFLIEKQYVSVSLLQRHFKIGYSLALKLMGCLEKGGVVTGLDSEGFRKLTDQYGDQLPGQSEPSLVS